MPDFPETADIETASDDYASRFNGPAGSWMLSLQERIVREQVGTDGKILDVGGGHAQVAGPLCEAGAEVTVTGSDPVCAERIRELMEEDRLTFRVVNHLEMPFEDRSFLNVVCLRLVTHCDAWTELIAELCRVAETRVVIDFPTGRSLNVLTGALFGMKKKLEGNTRPYTLFSERQLLEVFGRHGFEREKTVPQFFWPMVIHRKLQRPRLSQALEAVPRWLGLTRLFGSPVILSVKRQA